MNEKPSMDDKSSCLGDLRFFVRTEATRQGIEALMCLSPMRLIPLVLALALAACADGSTEPDDSEDLRYRLSRINGKAPPEVAADGSLAKIVFLDGALHLKANGIYFDSTELETTSKLDGKTTREVHVSHGLYTVSNDTIYFRSVNRPGEKYLMTHLTERSLEQRLATATLIYVR